MSAFIRKGRGELAHLDRVTAVVAFMGILSDLERIEEAGAALAFVRQVTEEHEPDARVFEAVCQLMQQLDSGAAPAPTSTAFRLRLLSVLGHAPSVQCCFRCAKNAGEGRAAYFEPRVGAIICSSCGGGPLLVSGVARKALTNSLVQDWAPKELWNDDVHNELRQVIDAMVRCQLERNVVGMRPIRSKKNEDEAVV